jgi:AcrR family transcriptional regulator
MLNGMPLSKAPTASSARRRIVAGARQYFLAHGFRRITMDDLAEELGMSKKTLYLHFPSKTELIKAALLDKLTELEGELEQITTECATDFVQALQRLLAAMQRQVDEIQPPFVRDIRRDAPELFKLVETRRAALIERYFGKLFAEGRREGMIRKDVPVWLIIEILLAATREIMNPARLSELHLTPKAGYGAIIAVVLEGALTAAGRSKL